MLYRGQNLEGHIANNGTIRPNGSSPTVVPLADGSFNFDGRFTYGKSEDNAAPAHHIAPGKWDGCFISLTRDHAIARRFATNGNQSAGVIYHIDEAAFDRCDITAKEFPDPLYPHEFEVSVHASDCGPLPAEVVVHVEEVLPEPAW